MYLYLQIVNKYYIFFVEATNSIPQETDAINDMNERDVKKRKSESNLSENVGKIDNNNDIIQ